LADCQISLGVCQKSWSSFLDSSLLLKWQPKVEPDFTRLYYVDID